MDSYGYFIGRVTELHERKNYNITAFFEAHHYYRDMVLWLARYILEFYSNEIKILDMGLPKKNYTRNVLSFTIDNHDMQIYQCGSGLILYIVEEECEHQFLDFFRNGITNILTVEFVKSKCPKGITPLIVDEIAKTKPLSKNNGLLCQSCGPLMDKYFDIIKGIFCRKFRRPDLLYKSILSINRIDHSSLLYKCFRYIGNHKYKFNMNKLKCLPRDIRDLLHIYFI